MTEDNLILLQLTNLARMEGELEKLKKKYEKRWRDWLKKTGEYLIEPEMLWALFKRDAVEYKELHRKIESVRDRLKKVKEE